MIFKFLKECRQELNKVVWPSREEVGNSTIVVLIGVVIISIFLFTAESIFEKIFDTLVSYSVTEEENKNKTLGEDTKTELINKSLDVDKTNLNKNEDKNIENESLTTTKKKDSNIDKNKPQVK